jgi:type I restriction enzyme, S subunit
VSNLTSTIIQDSISKAPLPNNWLRVGLRNVIREAQGGFASGERDSSGVIQLRMNNVMIGGQFDWSSFIRVPASPETVQVYQLKRGDVLFNNTNSTELVGKSALFEGHSEPVVFSNHFTRLRADENLLEPRFLASWLQYQWRSHVFADICNRWIGQSAVQRDKLLALEIPLPPLSEQKRIAAILKGKIATVELARAAAEAQLKAAKELPAAYLHAIFDGEEAKGWQRNRFDEITTNRLIGLVRSSGEQSLSATYPYLKMDNITIDGHLRLQQVVRVEATSDEVSRYHLRKGDFLFNTRNSFELVGKTAVFNLEEDNWLFNNNIMRVRFSDNVVPDFVLWAFHSDEVKAQLESVKSNTTNVCAIYDRQLATITIPLPPLEKQQQISHALNDRMTGINQMKHKMQEEIQTINQLPDAILRQAFTGKL